MARIRMNRRNHATGMRLLTEQLGAVIFHLYNKLGSGDKLSKATLVHFSHALLHICVTLREDGTGTLTVCGILSDEAFAFLEAARSMAAGEHRATNVEFSKHLFAAFHVAREAEVDIRRVCRRPTGSIRDSITRRFITSPQVSKLLDDVQTTFGEK